ncbi:hypothetical protein C7K08_13595 [Synechococcus lacustris str. Tous]|uniref:Uncharacterized protein n=1 Tax=Synechococcus lacustris str. Tous TaxID=1910958 RepID=A0A2P7EAX1_9SYNE|nr:hypothetical protein C7K08_13595 [Synechococcus lacustris str. Tous]
MLMLIEIQLKTFAILSSCAALFIAPLAADAQLRRAGAPGYGVMGNPIGAPGIPAVESGVNLGRPINRHGLR